MNPISDQHQRWIYRQHPTGVVSPEHYELVRSPLSLDLSDGEILIQTEYISVDPCMRINQSLKPTYNADFHPLKTVQNAGMVGQVTASHSDHLVAGAVRKLDPALAPVSAAFGVLGMPGRTAWFGLG